MKSFKKVTAFVLALTMVFSMLIVAHALEDRSPTYPCSCGGTVTAQTMIIDEWDEYVECSHQSSSGPVAAGDDIYHCVTRETVESCDTCDYSTSSTRTTRTLVFCPAG